MSFECLNKGNSYLERVLPDRLQKRNRVPEEKGLTGLDWTFMLVRVFATSNTRTLLPPSSSTMVVVVLYVLRKAKKLIFLYEFYIFLVTHSLLDLWILTSSRVNFTLLFMDKQKPDSRHFKISRALFRNKTQYRLLSHLFFHYQIIQDGYFFISEKSEKEDGQKNPRSNFRGFTSSSNLNIPPDFIFNHSLSRVMFCSTMGQKRNIIVGVLRSLKIYEIIFPSCFRIPRNLILYFCLKVFENVTFSEVLFLIVLKFCNFFAKNYLQFS